MKRGQPSLTLGVEEEYLLVDRETRALIVAPPKTLMQECEKLLSGKVGPELLQSQIEIGTDVCRSVKEARADLAICAAPCRPAPPRTGWR